VLDGLIVNRLRSTATAPAVGGFASSWPPAQLHHRHNQLRAAAPRACSGRWQGRPKALALTANAGLPGSPDRRAELLVAAVRAAGCRVICFRAPAPSSTALVSSGPARNSRGAFLLQGRSYAVQGPPAPPRRLSGAWPRERRNAWCCFEAPHRLVELLEDLLDLLAIDRCWCRGNSPKRHEQAGWSQTVGRPGALSAGAPRPAGLECDPGARRRPCPRSSPSGSPPPRAGGEKGNKTELKGWTVRAPGIRASCGIATAARQRRRRNRPLTAARIKRPCSSCHPHSQPRTTQFSPVPHLFVATQQSESKDQLFLSRAAASAPLLALSAPRWRPCCLLADPSWPGLGRTQRTGRAAMLWQLAASGVLLPTAFGGRRAPGWWA